MHIRSVVLMASLLLLLGAVVTAGSAAPPVLPPVPTYECIEALELPVINGRLNDPIWEQAPSLRLVDCATGSEPTQATEVRMVWHGDYLYLAARVAETNLQDHNRQRNDQVFNEQCLELYLGAPLGVPSQDGGTWHYLETDVSPTGVLWTGRIANSIPLIPAPGKQYDMVGDTSYQPADLIARTTVAGKINDNAGLDKGWRVELQIPLSGPQGGCSPAPGELWPMNLYRVHNLGQPDQELQAWSPTGYPWFHYPQRFGRLKFVGPPEWPSLWPWTMNW
jgi:hypothetical protein